MACQERHGDAVDTEVHPCVLFFAGGSVAATWDRALGDAMAGTPPPVLPAAGDELEFEC